MIGLLFSSGAVLGVLGIAMISLDQSLLGAFFLAISLMQMKSLVTRKGEENGTSWDRPIFKEPK